MINAVNKKTDFEIIPEGSYIARIYQIIHVGHVKGYQDQIQNKARITFELPTETKVFDETKGEQPRVISQEYTLSFNEKANLRKLINACDPKALKAVDGDGFLENYDIENLLGKSCLITIAHKNKLDGSGMYASVSNATVLPKGMSCPDQVNPSKVLNYTDFDQDFFLKLPQFLQDQIKSSQEYKALSGQKGEFPAYPVNNLDEPPF